MRKRNHYPKLLKTVMFAVFITACSICMSISAHAATGLDVSLRTKNEIIQYIENSGMNDSVAAYEVGQEPSLTAPYTAGTLSDATKQNALAILNTVRYIAGLSNTVTLDDTYTAQTQAAALVNCVNDELSHFPEQPENMEDELYQQGYTGASKSNIYWTSASSFSFKKAIINGWMADDDSGNIDRLGHRRWCLNPSMGKTGFGAVMSSENGSYSAMYAFDLSNTSAPETTVAWPAQCMPLEYFSTSYPWNFSRKTAFSADASVKLTRKSDGKVWNFSSESADGYFNINNAGYGMMGCLVFRPSGIGVYREEDQFEVEVTENGTVTASYVVNFFSLSPLDDSVKISMNADFDGVIVGEQTLDRFTISDQTIDSSLVGVTSSDENIATVRQSGNTFWITGVAPGTVTITATLPNGVSASCIVTVAEAHTHSYDKEEIFKAPTCTETGAKGSVCSICNKHANTYQVVRVVPHSYDEGMITKEPTCSSSGTKIYTCTVCQTEKTETIQIVSHLYETEYTVDKEATCGVPGSKSRHCKWYDTCHQSTDTTDIAATGRHSFGEGVITQEPTCSSQGTKTYTCSVCQTEKTENIERVSHIYDTEYTVDKEATCGASGSKSRHCKWYDTCHQSTDATDIDATGRHSFGEGVITQEPTCSSQGTKTYTCSVCQTEKTENIERVSHIYETEYTVDKEATCSTTGSKSQHCKWYAECGSTQNQTDIPIDEEKHNYRIVECIKEPTCNTTGEGLYYCTVCEKETEKLMSKVPHAYDDTFTIDKAPTCGAPGSKSRHCKWYDTCHQTTDITEIAATGNHRYGAWKITRAATIFSAGSTVRSCTVCGGAKETKTLAKLPSFVKLNATKVPLQLKKSSSALAIKSCTGGDKVEKWISSNPKVVYVNKKTGKITGKKIGTANITVIMKSGARATCKITVQKKVVKTKTIKFDKKSVTLKKGQKYTLYSIRNPITGSEKLTFKSSKTSVAVVSAKGVIQARKKGTTTISVFIGKTKKASCKIVVK